MQTKTIAKQWGSSLGVIIPKEIVEKEKIRAMDELIIDVKKKADIARLFGSLTYFQQFKTSLFEAGG